MEISGFDGSEASVLLQGVEEEALSACYAIVLVDRQGASIIDPGNCSVTEAKGVARSKGAKTQAAETTLPHKRRGLHARPLDSSNSCTIRIQDGHCAHFSAAWVSLMFRRTVNAAVEKRNKSVTHSLSTNNPTACPRSRNVSELQALH